MGEHYFSEKPTSVEKRGIVKAKLRGFELEFVTSSGVFSYRRIDRGTRLLVESMILPKEGRILDLGCGYGVVGVVAGKVESRLEIWMTDVNERAVSLARINLERNGINGIVKQGDLYDPVSKKKFRTILSNPPISAGIKQVVGMFVNGAVSHLEEKGTLQIVIQSNKGGRILSSLMEDAFGQVEILDRSGGYRVLMSTKN